MKIHKFSNFEFIRRRQKRAKMSIDKCLTINQRRNESGFCDEKVSVYEEETSCG
jgi:hypothetical protein